ncbi:heat shock factor family protein [Skeletonema marinoi]|uniref:Heat shock factor family protein n=1 Tax=Skeletonema marinoi TaxID=267567 RepID=A0AAD9DCN0_9STRA|nr:heat shock factor family protein [Skeletonema marinoi]
MNPPSYKWASAFFDSSITTTTTTGEASGALPGFINCTYRDFSTHIEEGGKIQKHKKSDNNFPARLHAMLSNEQYSHIIAWMPHGRAWKVLDRRLLVEEAIPRYFKQNKYPSFARQLSGWGFKRLLKKGPDMGCYYHECFLRGYPRLTTLMRRISPGMGKAKATLNILTEPDLNAIAKQFPLHADEKPGSSSFETKAKGSSSSQEEATFDSLPVDSLAPMASLTSRGEISAHQLHVKNGGNQYMGKAEDETGRMSTTMYRESYLGAAGNLYREDKDQGRSQGEMHGSIGNGNQQHCAVHHVVHHTHPSQLQSHFRNDPMNGSIPMNGMNPYRQYQPESISGQQRQAQGPDQPIQAAVNSLPNSSSQNPTADSLPSDTGELPRARFRFNTSSLEDFRDSPLDPTTDFLGYNRMA